MRRPGVLPLAVAALLAGCVPTSSLAVDNRTSSTFIVRLVPQIPAGTFGYVVDPGARAWAWSQETGTLNGRLLLMSENCRLLQEWSFPPDGGVLEIEPGAAPTLLPIPADLAPTRGFLSYSSRCAEAR